jgi:hypothetical protein
MEKSLEVPSRGKNASLQRITFRQWRSSKKKIIQSKGREIIKQQWRGLKKNIIEELHHLEDLTNSGTKLSFLDYVIPATIFGTRI